MNKTLQHHFAALEATRTELLQLIEQTPLARRHHQPAAGAWSMVQVITHLTATEQGILAYMRAKIAKGTPLKAAGLASWGRMALVNLALRYRKRIKAPSVVTVPSNALMYEAAVLEWSDSREQLRQFLEDLPPALLDREIFRHPLAGMMRLSHTLRFMRAHVRHHRGQIHRLAAEG